MTKVDLTEFRDAAEAAGGEYYGHYNGRSFFKGFAAVFDNTSDLVRFGVELGAMDDLRHLGEQHAHIDSLGKWIVIAFDERLFDADTCPGGME